MHRVRAEHTVHFNSCQRDETCPNHTVPALPPSNHRCTCLGLHGQAQKAAAAPAVPVAVMTISAYKEAHNQQTLLEAITQTRCTKRCRPPCPAPMPPPCPRTQHSPQHVPSLPGSHSRCEVPDNTPSTQQQSRHAIVCGNSTNSPRQPASSAHTHQQRGLPATTCVLCIRQGLQQHHTIHMHDTIDAPQHASLKPPALFLRQ